MSIETVNTPVKCRPGPDIRSDIVDVFVFRREIVHKRIEFLQMRRAEGALIGSWHPVMGHIEWLNENGASRKSETAPETARRELTEETGYVINAQDLEKNVDLERQAVGFWQLELVNTYYLASHECIVMSPGFAVEVKWGTDPIMDASHDAFRWITYDKVDQTFLWPGHRVAIQHIIQDILASDNLLAQHLCMKT